LTEAGDPAQISAASVTIEFFATLQAKPQIGRGFLAEEDQPGHDNVVVLGNNSGRSGLVQTLKSRKTNQARRRDRTVIGIMPAGFDFPYDAEVVDAARHSYRPAQFIRAASPRALENRRFAATGTSGVGDVRRTAASPTGENKKDWVGRLFR